MKVEVSDTLTLKINDLDPIEIERKEAEELYQALGEALNKPTIREFSEKWLSNSPFPRLKLIG